MRYAVKIIAVVECPTDAAAQKAAAEIQKQLASPYVKVLLSSGGVSFVGHRVDLNPQREK